MHDVTEGGVATALEELGTAGGCRIRVHLDRIPVCPQTARACGLLGIDPLGLIGSGCLLIACAEEQAGSLERAVRRAGIDIARVGEVTGKGSGIESLRAGRPAPWPRFEVDELARFLREH